MKNLRSIICLVLCVPLLVMLVRLCGFSILTIPQDGEAPILLQGDRVLVNKWAYGLRRPFSKWGGYLRYRSRKAVRGDWMVFNNPAVERDALPDTSSLCVGCVLACPGDTIWMGNHGRISSTKDFSRGCIWPICVPARGTHVRVTPWTAPLYALIIQRHEGLDVSILNDSIAIDGHLVNFFRFQRDYYWVISGNEDNFFDSRTFGFVPAEFVLGKITTVLYSIDPQNTRFHRWRRERMFRSVQ